jgi:hypothetical protein
VHATRFVIFEVGQFISIIFRNNSSKNDRHLCVVACQYRLIPEGTWCARHNEALTPLAALHELVRGDIPEVEVTGVYVRLCTRVTRSCGTIRTASVARVERCMNRKQYKTKYKLQTDELTIV